MKKTYIYIATITFLSIFIAAQVQDNESNKPNSNKDLIIFSHQFHIEMETECETCHSKAAKSAELGISLLPTMDACAECHDVEDDDECSTCHYEDVLEPFTEKKAELYFDHSMHVGAQEMACTTCHAGLDKVDYAFESITSKPSMDICSDCHNNQTVAANNCETCHISTANLIPESHQLVDFFKNHQFADMNGNKDCAVCHDNNFCEACHTATIMITETNTASDFYSPYSPHKMSNNGKEQQITLVHDLNFRYTHGIEARGKSSQCQTCHQPETFCAECHSSDGGDYAMGGIVPLSHTVNGFATIGFGTGGGQHAVDAKRDIESCVSCHDIEGNDPTCVMCHVDYDGVQYTNPKTHEAGFMHGDHGAWHDDDGSTCFNCHMNTRIAGTGFCGYCHGQIN